MLVLDNADWPHERQDLYGNSLCNALGETVNCSKGYQLSELLSHHMVFDIAELKADAQTFFTETFLTQVVWHRIEKRERGRATASKFYAIQDIAIGGPITSV